MFSGIIEEKAHISKVLKAKGSYKLTVKSEVVSKDARVGDSISVSGACLTVVEVRGKNISFDIIEETLHRTNLSGISIGEVVNLERSLRVGDRISGHFVTGHVDYLGKIRAVTKRPNDVAMDIEFSIDRKAYLTEKGSIAINGVSLTIAEVKDDYLRVYLIPLTLKATDLSSKKTGDLVNIEFDILSKYSLQNPMPVQGKSKIDINFLKEHGFL
jgi:riboflavin synthase